MDDWGFQTDEWRFVDKVWIAGAVIAGLISCWLHVTHIPHFRESPIQWPLLWFVASMVVFMMKLCSRSCWVGERTLVIVLMTAVLGSVFGVAQLQSDRKVRLIDRSPALTSGFVQGTYVPQTRLSYKSTGPLRVVYRYSVAGRDYLEADEVAATPENRAAYSDGAKIAIRYAITDPSVSEVGGIEPASNELPESVLN